MKRFAKVILALVILVLFLGTLGLLSQLIEIPGVSMTVDQLLFDYPWLFYFFEGTLLILGSLLVILLVVALSVSGQRNRLIYKDGKNRIEIPKSTIRKIVEDTYAKTIHPDKTKLKIKIKPQSVYVDLKVGVRSKERFQPIAEDVKEQIQLALADALETVESHVAVHLSEEESMQSSNRSRVV
ncbi:alkaline shock response membrane anchor protein AmaP [Enterococcus sp. UD-01]|jgi:hypothetical protein|uniref:alkaline shock response membrane anchor protein AmaP n=1 Tax=Enterococcus sp. UD-01 TaxID=3373911 RepID=UPI003832DB15